MFLEKVNDLGLEFLYKTRTHPEVAKYLSGAPPPDYASHLEYMKSNKERFFLLKNKESYIGYSQITAKNNICEVGFVIHPEYQGLGYGKEIVGLTLEKVKEKYSKVFLYVLKKNFKAEHIYSLFGFNTIASKSTENEWYMELDLYLKEKTKMFKEPLHVGRPNVGNIASFQKKVADIFNRKWFTNNGYYVQELENKLKAFLGVRHCIPICNATIALEIAARALDLKGEVIVPSFTFVATPHSLSWQEITPIFCDINPETHLLDIKKIKQLITGKTTGILAVHVWGKPSYIEDLEEICKNYKLKLLFDSAHAFGCSYKGIMLGNFGDAEVFSFHSTKFFNTFEGGAIATNNDELAAKIRLMKNFGFSGPDKVIYKGTNGKMTEISAAMGLTSLESIDTFISKNYENYLAYQQIFEKIPGIKMVLYDEVNKNNYQYIIIEIDTAEYGFSRDALMSFLHSQNVLVRRYFYPGCHHMEPYKTYFPNLILENTEELCKRVLSFPNGTAVSLSDIKLIGELILDFYKRRQP